MALSVITRLRRGCNGSQFQRLDRFQEQCLMAGKRAGRAGQQSDNHIGFPWNRDPVLSRLHRPFSIDSGAGARAFDDHPHRVSAGNFADFFLQHGG